MMTNEELRDILYTGAPSYTKKRENWVKTAEVQGEPLLETKEYLFQQYSFTVSPNLRRSAVVFFDKVNIKQHSLREGPDNRRAFLEDIRHHFRVIFVYYLIEAEFGFNPEKSEDRIYKEAFQAIYDKYKSPAALGLMESLKLEKFHNLQKNLTLKIDSGKTLSVMRERWVEFDKKEIHCKFYYSYDGDMTNKNSVQSGIVLHVVNRKGKAPSHAKLYKTERNKAVIDQFFDNLPK